MAASKRPGAPLEEVVRRKEELLDRYRAERLEQMLRDGRAQAVEEAERGRFAWKGEFRPREEILYWYSQRRRWDRRFLLDSVILIAVLVAVFFGLELVVKMMLPDPNFTPR